MRESRSLSARRRRLRPSARAFHQRQRRARRRRSRGRTRPKPGGYARGSVSWLDLIVASGFSRTFAVRLKADATHIRATSKPMFVEPASKHPEDFVVVLFHQHQVAVAVDAVLAKAKHFDRAAHLLEERDVRGR